MCIWTFESSFCSTKERNGSEFGLSTAVIYACFILHNFCEENKDFVSQQQVRIAVRDEHTMQPMNVLATQSNETKGKRRRVLTKYLDPELINTFSKFQFL